MTYNFLETLYDELKGILSGIVVKRPDLAREAETADTARAFETYLACVNGTAYFDTFSYFDLDILRDAIDPTMSSAEAEVYNANRKAIPADCRDAIVSAQIARTLERFEERNEYYRMLNGKPPLSQVRPIYVRGYTDIDPNIPIENLTDAQISHLELRGDIDRLKAEYPQYGYLDYLGGNRIDLITARLAKPFDVLRIGPAASARTIDMFYTEYYNARRYIMSIAYNPAMFASNQLYYPTVGVLMLTLAVRNTLVPSEYDYLNFEEILNAILESYGLLRYFERFPFTFKRRLVLALDNILTYKGTDGVLLDICKIFSFDNFTANRYYIMKTYKKDVDGNLLISDNPRDTYDLNFVKADIATKDINTQEENIESYENVTDNDYLWQLSEEEHDQMLKENFNLMMSKYVDVEAAYDVTSLTFEVCCFINLLTYARDNLEKVRCTNMYSTNGYSNVYTMIVFLLAGLAKRSNFDGNIIYSPDDMAEVMRFNYGDIMDEVKYLVDKYELLVDKDAGTQIVPGMKVELDTPAGVMNASRTLEIFVNNRALYDAILEELAKTDDIRHYEALSKLRDLMFYSAQVKESFTKGDGTSAETYYDMLYYMDPKLAIELDSCTEEYELNNILLYTLEKLEGIFQSDALKYLFLNTPNTYVTLVSKYLKTAINVFKASSVQLRSINIMMYLGDRTPIRVLETNGKHSLFKIPENIHVIEELGTHKTIILEDYVACGDKVYTNLF